MRAEGRIAFRLFEGQGAGPTAVPITDEDWADCPVMA